MLRMSLMMLATSLLAQLVPAGCPFSGNNNDTSLPDRGVIGVQASATPTAAARDRVALSAQTTVAAADVSFAWLQVSGPGVRIDDANGASASFAAPSLQTTQTLRFRVTAHNAAGDVGSAEVKTVVTADPNFGVDTGSGNGGSGSQGSSLIARAGADKSAEEESTVTLDGSGSIGGGLTFQWRQLSGTDVTINSAAAARATFTAPAFETGGQNTLEFELVVRDSSARTARDRVLITITAKSGTTTNTRVRFRTSMGDFVMEMETQKSPNTVANFLQYVDDNFYNNTIVHRVVPGFVIQGGGFETGLVQKTPRDPVNGEAPNGLSNVRGTVAMALTAGNPNSGTSQWFVNLVDNTFLDAQKFTVFARVVEGMNIVDQIATVQTTSRNGFDDVPVTDVIVTSVERLPE
ncbi:MAG: peptidylprolyl isomerase [Phycisphaerales bacterium]|nr:peptidylprolyl isomerase [Phycisphaerales bacterium]